MRVLATLILFQSISLFAFCQQTYLKKKSDQEILIQSEVNDTISDQIVEWFQGGNVDFISNGLLRSSANLLLINLGNPNKFHIPFYLLVGATNDVFIDNEGINESTVSDILNKHGGYINFGVNGQTLIKDNNEHSHLFLTYLAGAKSIAGINTELVKTESFLTKMIHIGLMYHTSAWRPSAPQNRGRAWVSLSLSCSKSPKEKTSQLFGSNSSSFFLGLNIEGGIELKDCIDIRVGYYKYLNNHHHDLFREAVFKLSADFVINKQLL